VNFKWIPTGTRSSSFSLYWSVCRFILLSLLLYSLPSFILAGNLFFFLCFSFWYFIIFIHYLSLRLSVYSCLSAFMPELSLSQCLRFGFTYRRSARHKVPWKCALSLVGQAVTSVKLLSENGVWVWLWPLLPNNFYWSSSNSNFFTWISHIVAK
jgi:hypothetical protein